MLIGRLTPPANLTEELVRRLAAEIERGKLAPGAKLPTEQEMMAATGVSRTVVREAIAALRAQGLVVTRQGAGAFVAPGLQGRPFRIDPEELESLAEVLRVMELRLGVEVEAAGLAAERRTEANLAEIRGRIEAIDEAIAQDETGVDADFAFHRSILAAADNPYFPRFLEFLGRFIIPRQSVRVRYATGGEQRTYLERIQAEHRAIYEAICAGEPEAAREASRRHLCNSLERYRDMAAALDGAGAGVGRARGKPTRR